MFENFFAHFFSFLGVLSPWIFLVIKKAKSLNLGSIAVLHLSSILNNLFILNFQAGDYELFWLRNHDSFDVIFRLIKTQTCLCFGICFSYLVIRHRFFTFAITVIIFIISKNGMKNYILYFLNYADDGGFLKWKL